MTFFLDVKVWASGQPMQTWLPYGLIEEPDTEKDQDGSKKKGYGSSPQAGGHEPGSGLTAEKGKQGCREDKSPINAL